jgi:hypothetical protein
MSACRVVVGWEFDDLRPLPRVLSPNESSVHCATRLHSYSHYATYPQPSARSNCSTPISHILKNMGRAAFETESTSMVPEEPTLRSMLCFKDLDNNPVAPYELTYTPTINTYSGEYAHFKVKSNHIIITTSDGQPNRFARPHPDTKHPSTVHGVGEYDSPSYHWSRTLGGYIAAVMFGLPSTGALLLCLLASLREH